MPCPGGICPSGMGMVSGKPLQAARNSGRVLPVVGGMSAGPRRGRMPVAVGTSAPAPAAAVRLRGSASLRSTHRFGSVSGF